MHGRQLPYPLNGRIISHAAAMAWAGAVLCVAGLAFALWARVTLGRNWSGVVTLKEGHELVERGPYRCVRHPIYTGILTMFFATALVLGHVAGFAGVLLIFTSSWSKIVGKKNLSLHQSPGRIALYGGGVKRIIPSLL